MSTSQVKAFFDKSWPEETVKGSEEELIVCFDKFVGLVDKAILLHLSAMMRG